MSFVHQILLANLQKVASGLKFRLMSGFITREQAASYDPWQEVERSAEVDAACLLVADEVTAPGIEQCNIAFRIPIELAELVRWRLRDAERHLREVVPVWSGKSEPRDNVRRLLVEGWHTYAEPYWLARREQSETCVAGGSGR